MNEKTTCDILIRNTSILDENFQIRRSIFNAIHYGRNKRYKLVNEYRFGSNICKRT